MPEGEERRKEGRKERLRAAAMPLRHRRRRRETGRGENEQRHEQAGGRACGGAREGGCFLLDLSFAEEWRRGLCLSRQCFSELNPGWRGAHLVRAEEAR